MLLPQPPSAGITDVCGCASILYAFVCVRECTRQLEVGGALLIFLRKGLSLSLELLSQPLGSSSLRFHRARSVGAHCTPSFLHEPCRSELTSSSLLGKHFSNSLLLPSPFADDRPVLFLPLLHIQGSPHKLITQLTISGQSTGGVGRPWETQASGPRAPVQCAFLHTRSSELRC